MSGWLSCGNDRRGSGRRLVTAAFLSQHKRAGTRGILLRGDGSQAGAKTSEGVVPQRIAREGIEAEDFTVTGGQDGTVLQYHVDEI